MVGTFYTSPKPDTPTFVKVGDHVDADTIVCLVEAIGYRVAAGRPWRSSLLTSIVANGVTAAVSLLL